MVSSFAILANFELRNYFFNFCTYVYNMSTYFVQRNFLFEYWSNYVFFTKGTITYNSSC